MWSDGARLYGRSTLDSRPIGPCVADRANVNCNGIAASQATEAIKTHARRATWRCSSRRSASRENESTKKAQIHR